MRVLRTFVNRLCTLVVSSPLSAAHGGLRHQGLQQTPIGRNSISVSASASRSRPSRRGGPLTRQPVQEGVPALRLHHTPPPILREQVLQAGQGRAGRAG